MKIAVTGGAGYIGSTLIKNLIKEGYEVNSLDNLSIGSYDFLKKIENKNLKLFKGDIRDKIILKEVFNKVDAVAHLAAIPGLDLCNQKPDEAISTNVYGTFQVLEAAKEKKVEKIVFCSSAAVYGIPKKLPVTEKHDLKPLNLYGITKLAGEKLMESYFLNYSLPTISLRFGNVYGVGLFSYWNTVIPIFITQALNDTPLTIFGDGNNSRDFIHVEDISQAIMLALLKKSKENEVYNVGNETITINELTKIIQNEILEITGKKIEKIFLPPRERETKEFGYDLNKIFKKLKFTPEWSINNGVKQLIEYKINSNISKNNK